MSAYLKGYRAERDLMTYMTEQYGCKCIRSGGSHTPIDVLCGNGVIVYAVQVKYGQRKQKVDLELLRSWAWHFRAKPLIASRQPYGEWVIEEV